MEDTGPLREDPLDTVEEVVQKFSFTKGFNLDKAMQDSKDASPFI